MDIKKLTGSQENLRNVINYNDEFVATDTYMCISTKEYNEESIINDKVGLMIKDMIDGGFKECGEKGYKITKFEKKPLEECFCCKGTGYEKKCPCEISVEEYLFDKFVNEVAPEYDCPECEDTGTIPANKGDEGAYVCEECKGSGKIVHQTLNPEHVLIDEIPISKQYIQKFLHFLGDTVEFFPTKNKKAGLYFEFDKGEGVVMPMVTLEEEN